jgi:hypothetical protein
MLTIDELLKACRIQLSEIEMVKSQQNHFILSREIKSRITVYTWSTATKYDYFFHGLTTSNIITAAAITTISMIQLPDKFPRKRTAIEKYKRLY